MKQFLTRHLRLTVMLLIILAVSLGCSERRKEAARLEAEIEAKRRGEPTTSETQAALPADSSGDSSLAPSSTELAVADSTLTDSTRNTVNQTDGIDNTQMPETKNGEGLHLAPDTSRVISTPSSQIADTTQKQALPAGDSSRPVMPARPKEGYTVQIAGTRSADEAAAIVERFKLFGYEPYIAEVSRDGHPFYRVRIGQFETEREAIILKNQLAEQQHVDGWVDQGTW